MKIYMYRVYRGLFNGWSNPKKTYADNIEQARFNAQNNHPDRYVHLDEDGDLDTATSDILKKQAKRYLLK